MTKKYNFYIKNKKIKKVLHKVDKFYKISSRCFISGKVNSKNTSLVTFDEALSYLKTNYEKAKFDETLEVAFNLSSKTKDVAVRGSVQAPFGLGRKTIIAAFCDESISGVDYCGGEELIQKFLNKEIKKCDVCITTKKYMPLISSKIGKILGRKRIMPDPRFGTVVEDIQSCVDKFRKGVMNFRSNKNVIHSVFGKLSFDENSLKSNFSALVSEVRSALPEKTNISKIFIAPTMGDSIEIRLGGI